MTDDLFHFLMIFRIALRLFGVPKCFLKTIKHYLLDETFIIDSIMKFRWSSARRPMLATAVILAQT